MEHITQALARSITSLFNLDVTPELTRPDEQFGEYATNVALQLAGRLQRQPRDVATELVESVRGELGDQVKDITIAGPGFINITLSDATLLRAAHTAVSTKPTTYAGQVVVTEYSDPNPFKVLHAGHLYTTLVGDAISRLVAVSGGDVHRVNFGGDVGLHVAKNMWAICHMLNNDPAGLDALDTDPHKRAAWLSARYVEGNTAYEEDKAAKAEIIEVNKKVYQLHADNDHESDFAHIYWTCRQWSYDYFAVLYAELKVVPFEKYYPESETTPIGVATVEEQLAKGVYEKSDGAIIFNGEKYGLHTRVFMNSHGLPTYEAKDVGLIMKKWQDYHFDTSIIITGNDIVEYMKVVQKSIEQFAPDLTKRSVHLTHGNLKLKGGMKMSSRKGNVLLALDVLEVATAANKALDGRGDSHDTMLGAVKYAFLKQRIGGDIVYDPAESVSLEGNSGPYLQYAHARARSILAKADQAPAAITGLEPGERSLVRKISEYPDAVERAVVDLMPHHVCGYLYELAQVFNRFYEHNHVIGDERQAIRLQLVQLYADVLRDGLELLGITAPERM
ncbi:MAG: arginine--tRNA ligase [Candidatus Saccharibacteria bacterium]